MRRKLALRMMVVLLALALLAGGVLPVSVANTPKNRTPSYAKAGDPRFTEFEEWLENHQPALPGGDHIPICGEGGDFEVFIDRQWYRENFAEMSEDEEAEMEDEMRTLLLQSGKVLVIGGLRTQHTAVLLSEGRTPVGGLSSGDYYMYQGNTEILGLQDLAMFEDVNWFMVLLKDGRVLVAVIYYADWDEFVTPFEFLDSLCSTDHPIISLFPSPTNLVAIPRSDSRIDLRWRDNSTDESGFAIERCERGGFFISLFREIARVGPNVTRYSDRGLDCDTTYCYRVRAFIATPVYPEIYSDYSNTACATTFACPPPPIPPPPD